MVADYSLLQHMSLEQTLGTIPSGLFVVDMEMQIIYWNPAAERITGYSAKEAIGQPCSFMQGIPCGRSCGLLNAKVAKPIIGASCSIVTKSGQRIALLKNVETLYNADGEMIGGIESFNEITQQRNLEKKLVRQATSLEKRVKARTAELQRSESRFRSLLDSMDDLAYITSQDFKLTFMNRAMIKLFGDRVGESCYMVLHNQASICPWCPMEQVLNHRTTRNEHQLGDQGQIYEIIHSPLPNDDGDLEKMAVCRNITERTEAESALREANRELDAFAYSISHDLRGILSPVVTYMDFLRLSYHDVFDEQILQILNEVERQSERAIALLDDLLDLAKVGHVQPGSGPTDVKMLIEEIIAEYAHNGSDDIPKITYGELPSTWVPETLVYQILTNLTGNARNYARQKDDQIEVGCREEKTRNVYFVRDHGPGVTDEERASIFDIFYRGKASQGTVGTGVGLAIVRKIALRCGGETWVEDTPGGGATFCVALSKDPISVKTFDIPLQKS